MDEEQFKRVGLMAGDYYKQREAEPQPSHFQDWIGSLEEPMKSSFRKMGFEECKNVLNFRRFVAELNDRGMEEYMKANLSEEDYRWWQRQGK
ncbi:hypothetical protein [Pontibacter chitinilyticus]|uniref:hypothetical protein n=1 Tax=Pontibacter chitinilyticus TaxID=2674989 RepID=UPI00321B679C